MVKKLFMVQVLLLSCVISMAQKSTDTIRIADDLQLVKVMDNVYVHVSTFNIPEFGGLIPANGVVYVNGNEALLFDTPWTQPQTVMLVEYLQKVMHLKLVGFVPNHWHEDCLAGLSYLKSIKVPSYANQMTIELAKKHQKPFPVHGFKDSLQLQLGNKRVMCYYLGAAHSTDNIVIWMPTERVLFAGCMVKGVGSSNLGNTADGDLKAYPKTIQKVMAKFPSAKLVISGHGSWGGMEQLEHTLKLAKKQQQ